MRAESGCDVNHISVITGGRRRLTGMTMHRLMTTIASETVTLPRDQGTSESDDTTDHRTDADAR
jgi:hypothetical protein